MLTSAFVFVLICLASYRATHFLVADSFPPIAAVRRFLVHKTAGTKGSAWAEIYTCFWCAGTYITAVILLITMLFVSIPLPILQYAAACAVVGVLGNWGDK
jgi:hypothetical protein